LHHVEFGVKFTFFLKIYEVTWKLSWNMSYLVATRWVLFPSLLSSMSNLAFLLKFYAMTWKNGWNMFYMVATIWILFSNMLSFVSNSAFCQILCNYMKRWLN
jgi:hypothetical protein